MPSRRRNRYRPGAHVAKAAVDFAEMIGKYRERFDSEKGEDILHDLISVSDTKTICASFIKPGGCHKEGRRLTVSPIQSPDMRQKKRSRH